MVMPTRIIRGPDAWETAALNNSSRWGAAPGAFAEEIYPAQYKPKFEIRRSDRFFCLGSCFARNIEEHLIYCGVEVLSRRLHNPRSEWNARPNGLMNKFTTHSILNEILWLEDHPDLSPEFFTQTSKGWLDLQLATGVKPVSIERAFERRRYLMADYFSRLRDADVVVITLGLNEVWHDGARGFYLNTAPPLKETRQAKDRYTLEVTTVSENLALLENIRERLKQLCARHRIIITVSPVPLQLSFTGEDVVVANSRSKSVLRSAADQFADAHDDVDYFPSYEMVTMAPRALAFATDCRHVTDRAVGAIMRAFLKGHNLNAERAFPEFNEVAYLTANPDVDEAVRSGDVVSGYHHWLEVGHREGRALAPTGGPTPNMVRVGAA
jgi:hypothetical protein